LNKLKIEEKLNWGLKFIELEISLRYLFPNVGLRILVVVNYFLIENAIYFIAFILVILTTTKILKPTFGNKYLNDISNSMNFNPQFNFSSIFNLFKLKNHKNDESIFTLI
jgi:hypothetical protein